MNKIRQQKYIITTVKHVLCMKGFATKDKLNNQTLRLFTSIPQAKEYMKKYEYRRNIKYEIKKVNLEVEVVDDETEN